MSINKNTFVYDDKNHYLGQINKSIGSVKKKIKKKQNWKFIIYNSDSYKPKEIPQKIWSECWCEEYQYFDFTRKCWQSLDFKTQYLYSKLYKDWYCHQICMYDIETKKHDNKVDFIDFILVPPGIQDISYQSMNIGVNMNRIGIKNPIVKKVLSTKPFYISKYPITVGQFCKFGIDIRLFNLEDDFKKPICNIEFYSMKKFCEINNFRLPYEYEWNHVCNSGSTYESNISESIMEDFNNRRINTKHVNSELLEVGILDNKTSWGCYDLIGNVWEICKDYSNTMSFLHENRQVHVNPVRMGDNSNENYIHKGFGYDTYIYYQDKNYLMNCSFYCSFKFDDVGFRVVKDIS